jgi:hypothetical protein
MPAPATQGTRATSPSSGSAGTTINPNTESLELQRGPETVAAQRLTNLGAHCGVKITCGGSHA